MSDDIGFVIGRRAGEDGRPVGERHAVVAAAARKSPPYRAECGAQVDVLEETWPPENPDERACPICARDTEPPWV